MADQKPFAGLGSEETLQMIAMALIAISDKMPRTDNFDRLITNPSEVAPATTPVSGSLTTLTTLTTLTDANRINAFGAGAATQRPADAIPIHLSQMGADHIYSKIAVT